MTDAEQIDVLLTKIEMLEDWIAEPCPLVEVECIRCHRIFASHSDTKWCSRDCQMGWTPAPSYAEWYRSMHPWSLWLNH